MQKVQSVFLHQLNDKLMNNHHKTIKNMILVNVVHQLELSTKQTNGLTAILLTNDCQSPVKIEI